MISCILITMVIHTGAYKMYLVPISTNIFHNQPEFLASNFLEV